jgi:hypothetical protein
MPHIVIAARCHYCSISRDPRHVLPIGTGGARICLHCLEWHAAALKLLCGHPPPGCQTCGVTFAQLRDRAPDGDTRMYVHAKDGIYQILCKPCSDAYIPKRVDLYGDTEFGKKLKLAT